MSDKINRRKHLFKLIKISIFFPLLTLKLLLKIYKKIKDQLSTKLRFSITFKLTAVYTIIFIQILFVFSILIFSSFMIELVKTSENNLLHDYKIVADNIKNNIDIPKDNIDFLSNLDNVNITIFDAKEKIIYCTEKNSVASVFYKKNVSTNTYPLNNNYFMTTHNNYSYLVINDKAQWDSDIIYIEVTHNLNTEMLASVIIAFLLLFLNVIFIIITIKFGSKASKKMLKPVETMTNTVKNITINDLDTRLDISGSQDELKDLARTLNEMLNRIQNSYEQQNQFVSDASHELRTPISVILGYSNMLKRWGKEDKAILEESIDAIKSESEDMKTLVENLLFLARGDKNTQKIEKEFFYINELIDEILKETKLIDNNHEFISIYNERFQINADRKLIKEALRVFIDNCIKYTSPKGKITLNCIYEKNNALITIEDTGMGISKEDLPKIFDRFYRADKSRTKETGGTGLGLSIAKWIVFKHKGKIEVQSTINIGTKISISLPISTH